MALKSPTPLPTTPIVSTRLRPVGSQAQLLPAAGGTFTAGEVVDYYSSSQGGWIPAKVVAVDATGTYSLDCKPDVPSEKIRRPAVRPLGSSLAVPAGEYRADENVEYFGATLNRWIPAKVLTAKPDGTYDLDCKPNVLPDKMRRPPGAGSREHEPPGPWAGRSGGAAYTAGDTAEYYSASLGRWIPAVVLSGTSRGTFDLDCKPDVPPEKLRRPEEAPRSMPLGSGSSAPSGPPLRVDESVEYFGATLNKWIPAKVLRVNRDGTYDLDCKPEVRPDKVRRPMRTERAGSGPLESREDLSRNPLYEAGDSVDYYSASQQDWIPAKVLSVAPGGTYNLDCKPDVQLDKIRRPKEQAHAVGSPGFGTFKAGDTVEYFGASKGMWVPAKVLRLRPDGTYDLDCKSCAPPGKVRLPASQRAAPAYRAGDLVEYFGATQQRWIPAKVLAVNDAAGTYKLDCKPDVPPDSIRPRGGRSGPGRGGSEPLAPAVAVPDGRGVVRASGPGEPVQLLRAQRAGDGAWRYEVCPEGAAALERHGSRHIAVASICGPSGSGKSTLLRHLLRGLPAFEVTSSGARTQGLWLWSPAGSDDGRGPLLALLDCEGIGGSGGNRDPEHSTHLLTLCAMLSSLLVLNTKGAFSEELFSELSPACRLGENIEERGNEANRPMLLWVLRDFELELKDANDRPLTPGEYLERSLHAAPETARGHERSRSAREVRQSLLKYFSHRSCLTLARPATGEQLQKLDSLPYSALPSNFRAGVDEMREQLLTACLANPKAVGGQLLSCSSFVALTRQLVGAVNDGRILSMKGAWETVQHTTCGALADELRGQATMVLHALAAGRPGPGGAQLPLTDDALHSVLREQRHALKSRWDERAVGDEAVRREYWQELKETLAREQALARSQNARIADEQLKGALKAWQEWLDNDDDSNAAPVAEVCGHLGGMMEKMPMQPLLRIGRAAIQAAARRVSVARSAVAATVSRHDDLQRQAVSWGEQASQQEGATRTQLDAKKAELQLLQEQATEGEQEHHSVQEDLEAREAELGETQARLRSLVADYDEAHAREHDLKAQHSILADTQSSLRSEVEQLRADVAKADAERLASERCARRTAEATSLEQRRLQAELTEARAEVKKYEKQLAEERDTLRGENEKIRFEHQRKVEEVRRQLEEERKLLTHEQERTRTEHTRMVEDARQQLEQERQTHAGTLGEHTGLLLQRERRAGIFEGKASALKQEVTALRGRLLSLEGQVRASEVGLDEQSRANEERRSELKTARAEADRIRAETREGSRAAGREERPGADAVEDRRSQPKCGCSIQ